jgi:hypothetical protein
MEAKKSSLSKSSKSNTSMKKYAYIQYVVILVLLVSAAVSFSACDGEEPTAAEKQMKLLVGTWAINSVTVDGVDYSNLFNGFTLTFTDAPATYTPTNGGKVWTTASGFNFTDGAASQFNGPGGEVVNISTLTSNSLVLEMEWSTTTLSGGRVKSISGHHEFVFSK